MEHCEVHAVDIGDICGLADVGIGAALIAPSHFNGLIDELSVYNRALLQGELQGIYFNGSTGKCAVASAPMIVAHR